MLKSWIRVLLVYLFTFSPLHAQPEMMQLEPGRTPQGVVYYLPKTAIRIHLAVEKRTYTPGNFARYAERYLRLSGIQQEEQVSQRIIDCEISTLGIRDTSKCYAVNLKGKAETTVVTLSEQGTLLGVHMQGGTDRPTPQPLPAREGSNYSQGTISIERLSTPLLNREGQGGGTGSAYLSAEALAAGSTAKMAEITARQIAELREARQQLTTGDADEKPQDEGQLQLMLREIDHKTNMLLSLFTGTVQRDTTEHVVTFCPEKEMDRQVVFRLSRRLGLVDADDLSGVPFYMTLKNLTPEAFPAPVDKKKEGFYVNVPGMARLTLFQEEQQLAQHELPLAQFGFTELRDGDLFKRYQVSMTLNPATGAVATHNVAEREK